MIRNQNNQLTSSSVIDGFELTRASNSPYGWACIQNNNVSMTFSNCVFNMCSSYYGGIQNNSSSVFFNNCTFKNSNNPDNGLINNINNAESILINCNFNNNVGNCLKAASSSVGFNITNCEFTSNSGGSAISVEGQMLMVTQCRFFNNSGYWGSAISTRTVQSVIKDCVFVNNYSSNTGGAVNNDYYSPQYINCIFVNNSTPNYGGAMRNSFSSPIISNCTFGGNNGGLNINGYIDGGSCMSNHYSTPNIKNCIIWGNSGNGFHNFSSNLDISYSCGQVPSGYNNVSSNPMLINEGNPSGADGTFGTADDGIRIKSCSPAANSGNNNAVPAGILYDLAGNPRISLSIVDMGAYESQTTFQPRRYVKRDAQGPFDGSSWANAYNELQIAIQNSDFGDTIWVASGTYEPLYLPPISYIESFVMKDGVKIYGGFNGTETQFSQRNHLIHKSILKGASVFRVVNNSTNYLSLEAVLDGFEIIDGGGTNSWTDENGIVHTSYQIGGNGAGIYNKNSSPTIKNCTFFNNNAYNNFGGALFNENSNATISNCVFTNNKTDYYSGGAIYNKNFSGLIENCVFTNCNSKIGGGLFSENSGGTIQNCEFSQNEAHYGGGICFAYQDSTKLLNCNIISNIGTYFGGGIYLTNGALNLIKNCYILNNSAPDPSPSPRPNEGHGGGICVSASSFGKLNNCVFSQNWAKKGGAIKLSDSHLHLLNCTVAHNSAGESGGALFIHQNSQPGVTTIYNSIIWANNSGIIDAGNSSKIVNYSNIEGGYPGMGNINSNPLFINEFLPSGSDNEYRTYDDGLSLDNCSPSKNSGLNSGAGIGNTMDIASNPRIAYTTVDMGAYEIQSDVPSDLAAIAENNLSISQILNYGGAHTFANNCNTLITKILSLGANPINGSTTAKVWIENTPPNHFVKRHYEIAPTTNISTATGKVTLYFTQAEFDAYNDNNALDLPSSPTDIQGKARLRVEKLDGTSSDNSGLPTSYNGSLGFIDPTDSDIVWNNALNRWEVSFNTTGFGGYFVSTNTPVTYIFTGNGNWTVPSNWYKGMIPPTILPTDAIIIIDPIVGGQCTLNSTLDINISHHVIISSNKKLVIPD